MLRIILLKVSNFGSAKSAIFAAKIAAGSLFIPDDYW